jgi:DNA mismatch repair ATPase MutS
MAGFHKTHFEKYVNKLVEMGHKVVYLAQSGLKKDVERNIKRDGVR